MTFRRREAIYRLDYIYKEKNETPIQFCTKISFLEICKPFEY